MDNVNKVMFQPDNQPRYYTWVVLENDQGAPWDEPNTKLYLMKMQQQWTLKKALLAELKAYFTKTKLREASDGDYDDPVPDETRFKFNEVIDHMNEKFRLHRTSQYKYARTHCMSYQGFGARKFLRQQPNPFEEQINRRAKKLSWLTIDEALQLNRIETKNYDRLHDFLKTCYNRHDVDTRKATGKKLQNIIPLQI